MDGLLLIDKPADMTSHDVVAELRRGLKQKSIGHTGTLDPLATGLMVTVLGEATKISDYLVSEDKAYEVKIRLGVTSDTLDRTGVLTELQPFTGNVDQVHAAVTELQGDFLWPIPHFSAKRVDGKKLYERARAQEVFSTPEKQMRFWDVQLLSFTADQLSVSLRCSKGSFVRTWVDQLGQRLTCGAIVQELRRTRVGHWTVEQALKLAHIQALGLESFSHEMAFVPLARTLPNLRSVSAAPREARLMYNGQIPRDLMGRLIPEQKHAFANGITVLIKVLAQTGELLALLAAEPGQGLKIRRVFRYT